jgi:hypothetical protein
MSDCKHQNRSGYGTPHCMDCGMTPEEIDNEELIEENRRLRRQLEAMMRPAPNFDRDNICAKCEYHGKEHAIVASTKEKIFLQVQRAQLRNGEKMIDVIPRLEKAAALAERMRAEMNKQRPALSAVFDVELWELIKRKE